MIAADHQAGFVPLDDGGHLAYEVDGRVASPVLLLLRPLGGTMALWGEFRARLTAAHRVITFDHRGTGGSQPGLARLSTRALARDALHVLDHLAIARAHVFGISLGGMAATWLAALTPSRVARLCLASTPARGSELNYTGLRRGLSLAACLARPLPEVEPCLVRRIVSARFRTEQAGALAQIERELRRSPAPRATLVRLALAGAGHDARAVLSQIRARTLDLVGADDPLLGPEPGCGLASGIPGAVRIVLPDTGHDLTLERPELTADCVARFFAAD